MDMSTEVMPETSVGEVSGDLAQKVARIAAMASSTVTASNESNAPEPITLEEAKAHLRVFGSDEDDYIAALIPAAREMAEGRLNRTIRQRTRTAAFSGWGDRMVLLKPPFVSVESINYVDYDGASQALTPAEYYVVSHDEPAFIELADHYYRPMLHRRRNPITVSYMAGYAEGQVPMAIRQWMLLAIGALYNNRESFVVGTIVAPLPADFMQLLIQQYMVYE